MPDTRELIKKEWFIAVKVTYPCVDITVYFVRNGVVAKIL